MKGIIYSYWTLEDIKAQDLFDYLKLRCDTFVVEQGCAYPELDELDRKAVHIVQHIDDELTGCARVLKPGQNFPEASFGRIAIAPRFRGQKLGKRLSIHCLSYLQSKYPQDPIKIEAQKYLEPFYQDLGFQSISKQPFLDYGVLHVEMLHEADDSPGYSS